MLTAQSPRTAQQERCRAAWAKLPRSNRQRDEDALGPRLQPAPALRAGGGHLERNPLQHTPPRAISKEGFRSLAEATDEDLARMRQGNRFGTTSQETSRPTDRARPPSRAVCAARPTSAGSSGPRGRRSSRACGGAGFPLLAPQDSRPPKCAAPPRPQPQPPPQIIGQPDDVERLLDAAGQRAEGGDGRGRGCRCR